MASHSSRNIAQIGIVVGVFILLVVSFFLIRQCRYSSPETTTRHQIESAENGPDQRTERSVDRSKETSPVKKRTVFRFFIEIGVITAIVLLFILFFNLYKARIRHSGKIKNLYKQIEKHNEFEEARSAYRPVAQGNNYQPDDSLSIKRELGQQLNSLQLKLEKGFSGFDEIKKQLDEVYKTVQEIAGYVKPEQEEEPLVRYSYYPPPNKEGYFIISSEQEFRITNTTVYEVEVKRETPDKAIFRLIDDEQTRKRAINYYDSILKKACEVDDLFIDNPKSIVMVEPGELIKEEDKWKITKKTQVRYV